MENQRKKVNGIEMMRLHQCHMQQILFSKDCGQGSRGKVKVVQDIEKRFFFLSFFFPLSFLFYNR